MSGFRWGAIVIGVLAGLGITAAAALALFLAGARPRADAGGIAFIFAQFFGQVAAGYVTGRFASPLEAFNGAQAGLLLYAVTAVLTLSAGGSPGPGVLLFSAAIAMVLGAAGGVLAADRREG